MARKSRKSPVEVTPSVEEQPLRAAIYIRLSVEDKYTGSISIECQRMLIENFIERNPEITTYDVYIDNGQKGTTFDRPAFQRMLSDIEAGHVNCVIVKDLSRLGRNTIDTGYYIERYFREWNVRFIALTDQFDTSDTKSSANIFLPLRNMVNEAYALDISRKVKAQQRQAMRDGKYVGGRAPYGYMKDPEDCHRLVVDPVAAPVVRQIFQWASEGAGLNTIVRRLNEAGHQAPSHYKRDIGELTHEALIGCGQWQTRTVGKILRSGVYTGDMIQGCTKTIDHRQVPAPPEEWTVVHGTHEAIVSRELFDKVQGMLDATAREHAKKPVDAYSDNPLKGVVFCADCGRSLHRQRCRRKKTADKYIFYCLTNSRVAEGGCSGVLIYEDDLLASLMTVLVETMGTVLGQYKLSLADDQGSAERIDALKERAASLNRELNKMQMFSGSLYENLVQGVLDTTEYLRLKEIYAQKADALTAELETVSSELQVLKEKSEKMMSLARDAREIRKNRRLTSELIHRLIERVEVSHDKQITVTYTFVTDYEHYKEALERCVNM